MITLIKEQYSTSSLSENQFLGNLNALLVNNLHENLNRIYMEKETRHIEVQSNKSIEINKIQDKIRENAIYNNTERCIELYKTLICLDINNYRTWYEYGLFLTK